METFQLLMFKFDQEILGVFEKNLGILFLQ